MEKTGRLIIVEEGCQTAGIGSEISAMVAEEGIAFLDAPIKRIGVPDTPIPFSPPLEGFWMPSEQRLIQAINEIV